MADATLLVEVRGVVRFIDGGDMRSIGIGIVLSGLLGCASVRDSFNDDTTRDTKEGPRWPACATSEVACQAAAFRTAIEYCQRLQGDYQSDGLFNTRTSFFLGTLGTLGMLAGGVLSPIASGTAKTAWSGLSGAINGVQLNFQNAFGPLQEANRRAKISSYIDAFKTEYMASPAPARPYELSVYYASKCSTAGAVADQETLSAIASKGGNAASAPTKLTCNSEAGAAGATTMTCTAIGDSPAKTPP